MNIYIVCVGKIKDKYIIHGISEFKKRMQAFANLEIVELKEFSKEDNIQLSIKKESDELLKTLSKLNSYEILLDLNGKEFDSVAMSSYIENLKTKGVSSISFIIGGSDGVNEELKKKSRFKTKIFKFYLSTPTY